MNDIEIKILNDYLRKEEFSCDDDMYKIKCKIQLIVRQIELSNEYSEIMKKIQKEIGEMSCQKEN